MDRRDFLLSSLSSAAFASLGSSGAAFAASLDDADALPTALREKLMHDPFRPQYHLLPKANWMNDPCAPRFYRGQYHVFFQYNPGAAVWGDMHWAHATSADLMHWQHQPVAIAPTPGTYDAYGIFTGSVLPGMATPTVMYTGVSRSLTELETMPGSRLREVQCLATSSEPDLHIWTKLDKPVIEAPPTGMKVAGFRDPCPWKDGDTWYLIIGSGFRKVGGAVLLYRSTDGHHWEYLHPLAEGKWNGRETPDTVDSGEMWECPDFFPLGEKHVLLYSTERKVYWEVGTLDKQALRFHMETRGFLDQGNYYAMKSMVDAKGRRLLWGWVTDPRSQDELKQSGWAGSMALPRVLTVGADNRLRMQVPPEFATLQQKAATVRAPQSISTLEAALGKMPIEGRAGAIACSFKPGDHDFGLELRSGSTVLVAIKYDGTQPAVTIGDKTLKLSPDHEGVSSMQLWMDGSVIEIFVDDREAVTIRSFVGSPEHTTVAWTGSTDVLRSLSVSGVRAISNDRLTS